MTCCWPTISTTNKTFPEKSVLRRTWGMADYKTCMLAIIVLCCLSPVPGTPASLGCCGTALVVYSTDISIYYWQSLLKIAFLCSSSLDDERPQISVTHICQFFFRYSNLMLQFLISLYMLITLKAISFSHYLSTLCQSLWINSESLI